MDVLKLLARGLLAVAVTAALGVRPAAQQAGPDEVMAAFLYNFTKFVDWPAGRLGPSDPFRLCVVSDDSLREAVERTVAGESVNGRPLRSVTPRTPADARNCQILFVGESEAGEGARLLSAVRDLPVLTVGDSAGFLGQGGGIGFVREDNRLRFDVNLPSAERAGIKISSRLLRVARRIIESPKK